jgi:uncharacterized protein (DUF1800 family)
MATELAVLGLARFGLGARPGDLEAMGSDPRAMLLAELQRPNAALLPENEALPTAPVAFANMRAQAQERKDNPPDPKVKQPPDVQSQIEQAELTARWQRIQNADTGFTERLVSFWTNHFCIESTASSEIRAMAGAFEREAIRPHVTGRFIDMLNAVTRHPAMLLYLNNVSSIGPNSNAGQRRQRGLNENHARELMELHTVGVTGGYNQADVTSFARILTGWTVQRDEKKPETLGLFQFNKGAHEPGPQTVMGVVYKDPDERQGAAVLSDLARRPATAQHIATKLARHFVADVPPPALVKALAQRFTDTDGDLQAVTADLVRSDLAWQAPAAKLRLPQEFLWAAMRALDATLDPPALLRAFKALGQPLWDPPSPAGFKDDTATWLAPDALTTRIDIATQLANRAKDKDPRVIAAAVLGDTLSDPTRQAIARAESAQQGLTLLLMSPEFQRR